MVDCLLCGSPMGAIYQGSDSWFEETPDQEFSVFYCPRCGLGRTVPEPEVKQEFYPSDYHSRLSLDASREYSKFLDYLKKGYERKFSSNLMLPDQKGRLLEIGFGEGERLEELSDGGWEVIGIETNTESVGRVRERYGLEVYEGGITSPDIDLEEGYFDVVLMEMVFNHLRDPEDALDEITRVLSPGGRLVIKVSNIDAWARRIYPEYWTGYQVPRHPYHYSPRALETLLDQHGFILEEKSFDHRPNQLAECLSYYLEDKLGVRPPSVISGIITLPSGIITGMTGNSSLFAHRYRLDSS